MVDKDQLFEIDEDAFKLSEKSDTNSIMARDG